MYTIRINVYRNMEFIWGGVGGARDLEVCVAKEHAPLGTLVVQKLLYRVSPTLQYSGTE